MNSDLFVRVDLLESSTASLLLGETVETVSTIRVLGQSVERVVVLLRVVTIGISSLVGHASTVSLSRSSLGREVLDECQGETEKKGNTINNNSEK